MSSNNSAEETSKNSNYKTVVWGRNPDSRKIHTESYMHLYAKEVFRNWLQETFEAHRKSYFIFDWQGEGNVKVEYPIWSRQKASENCEEDPSSAEREIFGISTAWDQYPDPAEMEKRGFRLDAVVDLVICDGKKVKYGIEVVYKHSTPPWKCDFLTKCKLPTYEILAVWIMNQVRKPSNLDIKKITR